MAKTEVEILVDLLEEQPGSPVTARTIQKAINAPQEATSPQAREVVRQAIADGVPVCSCNQGYFIPTCEENVQQYLFELMNRAQEITARAKAVILAWQGWTK